MYVDGKDFFAIVFELFQNEKEIDMHVVICSE